MKEALESVKNLGAKKLAILGAAGFTLLVGLIVLASSVSSGSLSPIYTNLSLEDSNKIASELDSKGVKYELGGNGTTILVPGEQVLKLRMAFAAEGLPTSGSIIGNEIFDKDEKLGTSNFMQNMNQMRALEGELSRTIMSMNQIKGARVHLVVPKRELFQKDKIDPTASIQLTMTGGSKLASGEVSAIKYLVATAVPGLSPENITIVDSRGILLARGGGDPNDPGIYASTSQEYRANVESQMRNQIEELVEKYVGLGNVKAQVSADINFDRVVTNSELYDPESQVARSVQSTSEKELSDEGGAGSGASGAGVSVSNNLPAGKDASAGAASGGSKDNRQKTDEVTNYEISKTVKNQVSETGKVNKLSIAVMVDGSYTEDKKTGEMVYKDRSPEELKKLEDLVKSAVGFDEKRGDIVKVSSMKFSSDFSGTPEKAGTFAFIKDDFQSIVQILVMGLVAIMVILMVIRPLVKRAIEVNVNAQALNADNSVPLLGASIVPQIASGGGSGQMAIAQAAGAGGGAAGGAEFNDEEDESFSAISGIRGPSKSASLKRINELLETNPDEAISVIRGWLYGEHAAA